MKNKILFILTIFLLLIPLITNAASIKSTSAVGMSSAEVGSEIKVKFYINFDGIDKSDKDSLGVYELIYEIMYDESVLELKTIYTTSFNSFAFKEGETYFVYSTLRDNIPSTVRCSDGILFCSSYMMEATFKVLNDSKETTEVSIGDVEVAVHPMSSDGNLYEDDLTYISTSSKATKKIKITKPAVNNNATSNGNNSNSSNNNLNNNKKPEPEKSNNKYLKELNIMNYKIDFNKEENNYEISIPENINELEITAKAEDAKATVEITGNDDIKKYNNKIFVVVTAEDGSTNTYTISVKYTKEEQKIEVPVEKVEKSEDKKIELTKEQITFIGIASGIVLLIFIIVFIIIKINDRKIDKALDEL